MTLTLAELRARRADRRAELEKHLPFIQAQLERMGALRIILFGSFARGNARSESDLDLLCVMPSYRSGKEWMGMIYSDLDRKVDCDILAYTQEELDETLPVSRFLRGAMSGGRTIYEHRPQG